MNTQSFRHMRSGAAQFFAAVAFVFALAGTTSDVQAQNTRFLPVLQSVSPTADPAAFTNSEWKAVRQELIRNVQSDNAEAREAGLQYLIQFAGIYGAQSKLDGAANAVYEVYKLDKNEAHRIMALSALHALGDQNMMRHVAQSVRTEGSDRVRQLTHAALVSMQEKDGKL